MGKINPIVRVTLERLEERGELRSDEVVVQELAASDGSPGVLFVTADRMLFVRTKAFGDSGEFVELPLGQIAAADSSERRSPIRKRGVLALRSRDGSVTVLEHIPGGAARAEEIAGAILGGRG